MPKFTKEDVIAMIAEKGNGEFINLDEYDAIRKLDVEIPDWEIKNELANYNCSVSIRKQEEANKKKHEQFLKDRDEEEARVAAKKHAQNSLYLAEVKKSFDDLQMEVRHLSALLERYLQK